MLMTVVVAIWWLGGSDGTRVGVGVDSELVIVLADVLFIMMIYNKITNFTSHLFSFSSHFKISFNSSKIYHYYTPATPSSTSRNHNR